VVDNPTGVKAAMLTKPALAGTFSRLDHKAFDPSASVFVQRSAVGLIISIFLSAICLWRMLIFITALLRTEHQKASARRTSSG